MTKRQDKKHRGRCLGVSLIETVISMVILSGAMVATLNAVTGARASQALISERAKSQLLAESMLTEIMGNKYMEPGSTTLGRDVGETYRNRRDAYDDIDDFHGWNNDIRTPVGTLVAGFENYKIAINVAWVNPASPNTAVNADQGAKRITITVTRDSRVVAKLVGWATAP